MKERERVKSRGTIKGHEVGETKRETGNREQWKKRNRRENGGDVEAGMGGQWQGLARSTGQEC